METLGYYESICPVCKQFSRDFEVHFYCKKESVYLEKVIILTHYQNKIIQKLIKDAKFYHKKDVLEDLAPFLGEKLLQHIDEKKEDLLFLPTPMFFWKKIKRGYNQSEILVKTLSETCQIPYSFSLINKKKSTLPQSHLTKIERVENLKNAFLVNENEIKKYKNKTIILIDDVVSTGTTLSEIAKLLKQYGIQKVYAGVLASD